MEQKSSFLTIFGETPILKVLDFLIENQEFDYSLTEIARNSEIAWTTLHQFWKEFVKQGLVIKTRNIGRAEMYKLNTKSELVKKLLEMDLELSKILAKKEIESQKLIV